VAESNIALGLGIVVETFEVQDGINRDSRRKCIGTLRALHFDNQGYWVGIELRYGLDS
jgi:hypothetical protein